MHAVGPADRGDGGELEGAPFGDRHQVVDRADQEIGGADQGRGQRGIDHVRSREAVVDPRPLGRADRFLDDVDESSDVVARHVLPFGDAPDERGIDLGRTGAAGRGWPAGTTPSLERASTESSSTSSQRPRRGLVGEDLGHLG